MNIPIQQKFNEENNSSSQIQEPMETIPVEQIDHINAKSQKRKYPDISADKPFMESGACPPFIKPGFMKGGQAPDWTMGHQNKMKIEIVI